MKKVKLIARQIGRSSVVRNLCVVVLYTDKTKLKLDKEVGGGVLFELCTITYLITYPYARTVNFEICIDVQLTTHQPLIAKASQAAAWSYRYNGN